MTRLDIFMVKNGLAPSREKAKRLILSGAVSVNGSAAERCSVQVSGSDTIKLSESDGYVGRGAYKLLKAIRTFRIDVKDLVCADIGASTGGFTQALLRNGAKYVYAVDVGHGQLAEELLSDPRVKNLEGVNVRNIKPGFFSRKVGLFCCDLSFISLKLALPPLYEAAENEAEFVLLIKPQFEAGRASLNKHGIVTDPKDHVRTLAGLTEFFSEFELSLKGLDFSPISGGSGNIEYLAYLVKRKDSYCEPEQIDFVRLVDRAFSALKGGEKV